MDNCPIHSHDIRLNFNYDKKDENKEKNQKPQTNLDKYKKNDEITEKITSKKIKTEINKKEKKDIERAKSSHNKREVNIKIEDLKKDPNENKLNIINDNNIKNDKDKDIFEEKEKEKEKGKETEDIIPKDKEYNYFINSINEIRLPEYMYDLSFDILQNK